MKPPDAPPAPEHPPAPNHPPAATPAPASPPPGCVEAVRALARVARQLEKASGGLGMPQYRVLSAIAGGDQRASRVAERLGLGRPAISAAVDTLCREGYLERSDAPGDHRAVTLTITAAGRAELADVEARMVALLADLVARTGNPGTAAALAELGDALEARRIEQDHGRQDPA